MLLQHYKLILLLQVVTLSQGYILETAYQYDNYCDVGHDLVIQNCTGMNILVL